MIEANENIDLVTMRRQQDFRRAQDGYQKAVSEGRLAVRPHAVAPAQLAVPPPRAETSAPSSAEVQPVEAMPSADPEAAWRHTRLALTAGLVLLLLVVWLWQKRSGGD